MNGYELMAESYKALAKQGLFAEKEATKKIRIFEFLATCDKEDIYTLVDSSAFNDIIKAFCRTALENASIDRKSFNNIMHEIDILFDSSCADICEKN